MNIWDWAVKAHQATGMDEALIEMQDVYGQCVSLLVWVAWTEKVGRPLDAETLTQGVLLARGWERDVTAPIRTARRALKRDWADIADPEREALRSRVKEAEFGAERLLLEALAALTPEPLAPETADAGLGLVLQLFGASVAGTSRPPSDAVERLAVMFEAVDFC